MTVRAIFPLTSPHRAQMIAEREALRWIQKYIANFGGDPEKVTIFGESAGAMSVSLQMVHNGGDAEGLFRGAFMMSGSPIPTGDITTGQVCPVSRRHCPCSHCLQVYYDEVLKNTGCAGSSDSLQCLRDVDYKVLKEAINQTPGIFSYQVRFDWIPVLT